MIWTLCSMSVGADLGWIDLVSTFCLARYVLINGVAITHYTFGIMVRRFDESASSSRRTEMVCNDQRQGA